MSYFVDALKKYAVFEGRARRKEYWMYVLFYYLLMVAAVFIDMVLLDGGSSGMGILSMLLSLAFIIPTLAVGVRRLHDVGKSGWFMFISFIPLIGGIWIFILMLTEGERGTNAYGQNPKELETVY